LGSRLSIFAEVEQEVHDLYLRCKSFKAVLKVAFKNRRRFLLFKLFTATEVFFLSCFFLEGNPKKLSSKVKDKFYDLMIKSL
jgi:hypothetical protein